MALLASRSTVANGEVSIEPDHDEPASGPSFPIDGDTPATNNHQWVTAGEGSADSRKGNL